MDPQSPRDRRAFYRLRYPAVERPTIRINDFEYKVTEISEKGARILFVGENAYSIEKLFTGSVSFCGGETVEIEGSVVWSSEKEIAIRLSKGITLKRMMKEQARLHRKYPLLLDSGGNKSQSKR